MTAVGAADPLVSFIVLSYNYENYVGRTIRSILDQTVQDFELLVIDDVSKDRSLEVIKSFDDPRIRLHVNESNRGGAWGFNYAISLARGRYIATVDADDWIHPKKTELQLDAVQKSPHVQIVGTYVDFRDSDGGRHKEADSIEANGNQPWDFNRLDTWVLKNNLCRSSTLTDRRYHEDHGLAEPDMVYAADFELWTRALRAGVPFALVPKKLTHYRLHTKNVTHANPKGTFFEFAYIITKNLMPTIADRAAYVYVPILFRWIIEHPCFAELTAGQRYRLLARMSQVDPGRDYGTFRAEVESDEIDPAREAVGRAMLALYKLHPSKLEAEKLTGDIQQYVGARDWWQEQARNWETLFKQASDHPSARTSPVVASVDVQPAGEGTGDDFWRGEALSWRNRCVVTLEENRLLIEKITGRQRPRRPKTGSLPHLGDRALAYARSVYRGERARRGRVGAAVATLSAFCNRSAASIRYRLARLTRR